MVFSQLMDFVSHSEFQTCVARYKADRHLRRFSCWDQWLCMAFAQLTHRESLRDVESCLRAVSGKLYHLGLRGEVSRSTLARANERRDWRVYADLAQVLITTARPLYADEPFGVELDDTVYALDSTTIDVCLSLCPWARGYLSFKRLLRIHESGAFFVTRALTTTRLGRQSSRPVARETGLRSDQTVLPTGVTTRDDYPVALRRVTYRDLKSNKFFIFLTNNFRLPALTVAQLYQSRWTIEVFFKWIKQHLRIKSFLGNSENAIKTQIWTAVSVYLLVAIARKTLGVEASLYTFLQVVGLTAFERMPILQVFECSNSQINPAPDPNQLNLFHF